jgi:hypothetical protein
MLNDKVVILNQKVTNTILNFQSSILGNVTTYTTYRQVVKFHTFHAERVGSTERLITCSFKKLSSNFAETYEIPDSNPIP